MYFKVEILRRLQNGLYAVLNSPPVSVDDVRAEFSSAFEAFEFAVKLFNGIEVKDLIFVQHCDNRYTVCHKENSADYDNAGDVTRIDADLALMLLKNAQIANEFHFDLSEEARKRIRSIVGASTLSALATHSMISPKVNVSGDPDKNCLVVDIEMTPFPAAPFVRLPKREKQEATFMDYFTDAEEYPRNVMNNPLPINTLWEYISSSFLNGMINYVNIIDAHLLHRYTPLDEVHKAEDLDSYMEPPHSYKWVKPQKDMTQQEVLDLYTQEGRTCHTKFYTLRDDVLILARCAGSEKDDNQNLYVFFWFDRDSSDCCIGRFNPEGDSEEVIIRKFREYVASLDYKSMQLPLHFFQGWISS